MIKFSGYAVVFNERDTGGDIVLPGAFTSSLELRWPRLLFEHDPSTMLGHISNVQDDDYGLLVSGVFNGDPPVGHDGLSIGYRTVHQHKRPDGRVLVAVDLFEISVVRFPMAHGARFKLV